MKEILPDGIENVTFKRCNLDNVDLSNCPTCIVNTTDPKDKNTY